MALTPCPRCGNPVPDKAPKCPKCGMNLNGQPNNSNPNPSPNPSPNSNNKKRRTWIWIIVILVLIVLIAIEAIYLYCDNKAQEQEQMRIEAEQHRRDSIAAEQARLEAEAREAAEQARRDSIDWVSFTTPDLTLLDLHGHVKSVTLSGDVNINLIDYCSKKFNLNENGEITNLVATRNKDGQITSIKKKYQHDDYDIINIKWSGTFPKHISGNGIDWGSDETLTYSNGTLCSVYSNSWNECYSSTTTQTVSPTEFDNYGNWTKANLKINETSDGRDCGEGIEKKSYTKTVRRTITYYPR